MFARERSSVDEEDGGSDNTNQTVLNGATAAVAHPSDAMDVDAGTALASIADWALTRGPVSEDKKPSQIHHHHNRVPREDRVNWELRRTTFYSQLRVKLDASDGCCWLNEFFFLIPIQTLRDLCGLTDLSKLTSRLYVHAELQKTRLRLSNHFWVFSLRWLL